MANTTITKLNDANYSSWSFQMKLVLIENDLWSLINPGEAKPDPSDLVATKLFLSREGKAFAKICLGINDEQQLHVQHLNTPKEVWEELEKLYAPKDSRYRAVQLRRQLYGERLTQHSNMEGYMGKINYIVNELAQIGDKIDDGDLAMVLLGELPENWDIVVSTICNLPDSDFTTATVKRRLLAEAERRSSNLPKDVGAMVVNASSKPIETEKQFKAKVVCFKCGGKGHYARECRKKGKNEQRPKRFDQNKGVNMSAMCNTLFGATAETWIIDSGATHHMTPKRESERVHKQYEFHHYCEWLFYRSMWYRYYMRHSVLSVRQMIENGRKVVFNRSGCHIMDMKGKLLIEGKKLGRLYYVQTTPSSPIDQNDHVSLASECKEELTLELWHKRLMHPGKARKVQRLLDRQVLPSAIPLAEMDDNDAFTVVRTKKRRRDSPVLPAMAAQSNSAGTSRRQRPSTGRMPQVQEIRTTRAHVMEARARQASCTEEQCCFLEFCPEYQTYQYMKALEKVVGSTGNIVQFTKVNGQYLVGLANRSLAERLVREGLEIEGTLLKTFPFRRTSIRVTIGNLPFFVGDAAVMDALSRYGRITSIAPKQLRVGEFNFTDGRREAFILLHDGITVEMLPSRFELRIKGEPWPAFLTHGVKCSKCRGQGHRRANCPQLHGRPTTARRASPPPSTGLSPSTAPGLPGPSPAAPTPPAPTSPAVRLSGAQPDARVASPPSTAPRPSTPAPPASSVPVAAPVPPSVAPAPVDPAGPRSAATEPTPPARPDFIAPCGPLPAQGTLGPATHTPDVDMTTTEEPSAPSPAAVSTPPLPAPQPAGPTPSAPHKEDPTPAMTPPSPPPTPMEEDLPPNSGDCIDRILTEIINSKIDVGPLVDDETSWTDAIDAILHPHSRAPFLARLSPTLKKNYAEEKEIMPLDLVHADLMGPLDVFSWGGAKYVLTIIDESTRHTSVFFLKNKGETLGKVKEWIRESEKQTSRKLKRIRTDNGLEFGSKEWDTFCTSVGIVHEHTMTYTPQQNGVAERMNRTLLDLVRSTISRSGLPKASWAELTHTAAYVRNRVLNNHNGESTPYELWTGNKPSLKHLRAIGCQVFVHIPRQVRKSKLERRAVKGNLVGYALRGRGYRVWIPEMKRVVESRDCVFKESDVSRNDSNREELPSVEHYSYGTQREIVEYPVSLLDQEDVTPTEEDSHNEDTVKPSPTRSHPMILRNQRNAQNSIELLSTEANKGRNLHEFHRPRLLSGESIAHTRQSRLPHTLARQVDPLPSECLNILETSPIMTPALLPAVEGKDVVKVAAGMTAFINNASFE
ncbi:hypothetical protein LAZ67_14003462 [Cordylochernes scorpioides]|uniref:Uncharacterized protein n=1 Tax=Cordylochernes scorpioides TaxID=51811 RepID=A0ABY6L7K7_9ARAC|nr:hypothetical protein LAZ67_14003462 [Cordylochernes scorpioides]